MTANPASDSSDEEEDARGVQRIEFVVRLSDGDIDIVVDPAEATVPFLLAAVRQRKPSLANRRLKLIYNGHVLSRTTNILQAVVGSRQKVYLHCAIGEVVAPEELVREELEPRTPRAQPDPQPQGFDRLRATGFTEQDVAALRRQFGELYGTTGADQTALEDQWMDTGAQDSSDSMGQPLAVLLGAFAGVFVLVIVQLGILNRRQRNAVLLGAGINLIFTLLQFLV